MLTSPTSQRGLFKGKEVTVVGGGKQKFRAHEKRGLKGTNNWNKAKRSRLYGTNNKQWTNKRFSHWSFDEMHRYLSLSVLGTWRFKFCFCFGIFSNEVPWVIN